MSTGNELNNEKGESCSTNNTVEKTTKYSVPHKKEQTRRLVTFNVCGIKNVLNYMPWSENKTFFHMFSLLEADIICFQETKIQRKDLTKEMAIVSGFNSYFVFPANKKGYSGVAFYVNDAIPVVKAEKGITGWLTSDDFPSKTYRELDPDLVIGGYPQGIDKRSGLEIDSEGRAIVLDIGSCVLIGLYCPANSMGHRDEYRQIFMDALDHRVSNLIDTGRKVIVMGDLNIARELVDSAEGRRQLYKEGAIKPADDVSTFRLLNNEVMTEWEDSSQPRQMLNRWVNTSRMQLRDLCRDYHPENLDMYTCWNLKLDARASNFGSRIDYIIASREIECKNSDILPNLLGSDHCPVFADMCLGEFSKSTKKPKLCTHYISNFGNVGSIIDLFASKDRALPLPRNNHLSDVQDAYVERPPAKRKKTQSNTQQSILQFTKKQLDQNEQKIDVNELEIANKLESNSGMSIVDKGRNRDEQHSEWSRIFTRPKPPLCSGHNEPCTIRVTKKNGPNKGREFWMCSRPHGASDDPAKSKEYRCSYFKWVKER